jgi:hypothetical protein
MKTKAQIIKAKYINGIIKATDSYINTSRLKTAFFYKKKSCNQ